VEAALIKVAVVRIVSDSKQNPPLVMKPIGG